MAASLLPARARKRSGQLLDSLEVNFSLCRARGASHEVGMRRYVAGNARNGGVTGTSALRVT